MLFSMEQSEAPNSARSLDELAFLRAVELSDITSARRLMAENPMLNVDVIDALGRTALRLAVRNENREVSFVVVVFLPFFPFTSSFLSPCPSLPHSSPGEIQRVQKLRTWLMLRKQKCPSFPLGRSEYNVLYFDHCQILSFPFFFPRSFNFIFCSPLHAYCDVYH